VEWNAATTGGSCRPNAMAKHAQTIDVLGITLNSVLIVTCKSVKTDYFVPDTQD
jgi:hypothetical protein